MKSWGCPWFPFVLELSRIGGEIPVPPLRILVLRFSAAATGRVSRSATPKLTKGRHRGVPMARQHGTRQPAPGHRDGTIRAPASYPTWARERPSSEVWCQPAGARKSRGRMLDSGLGPAPPCYNMPPHSGLGCKGPEGIFTGAAAMKPWKTSSAMYEPAMAVFLFALIRNGLSMGDCYHSARRRENRKPA